MSQPSGRFIVLEGVDGAGTTTQAQRLVAWLKQRGHAAHMTQEPSSGPLGLMIREMLAGHSRTDLSWRRLALLFAADRLHHHETEIQPHLDAGCHVVCDRYVLSSLVYQSEHAPLSWVAEVNRYAPRPDATLVLDVDAEEAWLRQQQRGGSHEVYDVKELQRELCHRYRVFAPQAQAMRVAGSGTVEEVAGRIVRAVEPLLLG